jgi:GMP synthase-like glutamine amidotransferase
MLQIEASSLASEMADLGVVITIMGGEVSSPFGASPLGRSHHCPLRAFLKSERAAKKQGRN